MKTLNSKPIDIADHVLKMSQWFERFSRQAEDSPFYADLAKAISQDSELLEIIPDCSPQPVPNLFLSAVNFLLYQNPDNELARHYPNHFPGTTSSGIMPIFKNFCLDHVDAIGALVRSRRVQTNEVSRCALLMPALAQVASIAGPRLHLVDVGASSGLNLMMDSYCIEYSDGTRVGSLDSKVEIRCELRGQKILFPETPQILTRTGIDLHPIDLNSEDESLWALSLIWPDQKDRLQRFMRATETLKEKPVKLRKGSVLSELLPVLSEMSPGSHVCIMHSFTLNQFSADERINFANLLKQASEKHPVSRISLEWLGTPHPELSIEIYSHGERRISEKLAECHQHGVWINWLRG